MRTRARSHGPSGRSGGPSGPRRGLPVRPLTLTVFQKLLPAEVLVRELIDIWHKAPVYGRHLGRLREASPIDADPQVMTRIAW